MMKRNAMAAVAVVGLLTGSAGAQELKPAEFFEKKIEPVLKAKCYSCHSKDAKKIKGKLRLDSAEDLAKGGETGPVVEKGKPEKSPLYVGITWKSEDIQMPPKEEDKLTDEQLKDFAAWIKAGALHTRKKADVDKK